VLVVGPDGQRRATLATALDEKPVTVETASSATIETTLAETSPDCVVRSADGVTSVGETVQAVDRVGAGIPCVVTAVDGDEATAAAATRAGADDYVPRGRADDVEGLYDRVAATVDGRAADRDALRALNRAVRGLTLATDETAVCEVAVETAADVLGLSVTAAFLYDEAREVLSPTAWTDAAVDLFGEIPALEPGTSLGWETFQAGEARVVEEMTDCELLQNSETPVRSELLVPLGEYGVLVTGSTDPRAFEGFDVELCRSLAAATTAALQRTEREQSLQDYRTVFETIQDRVYVLDENSRFRLVTDPLCELLGYDRTELLGEPVSKFVAEDGVSEGVRRRLESIAAGEADRESLTVETQVYDACGERVPVEADIVPFPDDGGFGGSVGVVHDVSERKRVERELAAERNRLTRLFEALPDAVVYGEFRDGVPIVQSVNERFEESFGWDEETLVGENVNEFIVPPELESESESIDNQAIGGEFPQREVRRQTADGLRYFLFRGVPVEGPSDNPEGFGIYTDITDQKTRERRLQVLNRVLRHNLRNEMNVVVGNADLIADGVADAELSDVDVDVAARAQEIIDTATDVATIGERVRQLERALDRSDVGTVDLTELVADAVDEYHDRQDVTVSTALPESLAVEAGDLLAVALDDLVENAVEHGTPPTHVTVVGRRDGEWIELAVNDDGPGIPDEEIAALTESTDTSQLSHGSGLGLWLVDWLTTSLGGEVRFEDNDPRGSVVKLRLPAVDIDD